MRITINILIGALAAHILLNCTGLAHADDWFCTSQGSKVIGNKVYACGVAQNHFQSMAMDTAFQWANVEFTHICELTTGCKNAKIIVEPQRAECVLKKNKVDQVFVCYREIVYTIEYNTTEHVW